MSDLYNDNYFGTNPNENKNGEPERNVSESPEAKTEDVYSSYQPSAEHEDVYNEPSRTAEPEDIYSSTRSAPESSESSYEWNTGASGGEYRHSYVNGNNRDASHNPNRYDGYTAQSAYQQPQGSPYGNQGYTYTSPYGRPNSGYTSQQTAPQTPPQQPARKAKVKKEKKPASKGFIAAMLVLTMVGSAALGFGGGFVATRLSSPTVTTNGGVTINQVTSSGTSSSAASTASSGKTSEIVKKTADSVVEIATEGVTTGSFYQQYITKGAGSGVIISEDGYIITNYHVIENANNITVTLRDGSTSYTAAIIGSDEDNDIALLKIDASGLSAATFGDSSTLAVGDYVVAIGNPLGELGGTVTDGIISALAREVTIEDKNMTLLQTNAQISPGNSGGGLFNSNGELIGIVNAKDSATEVEGIAFAIPVNNVINIISDLKNYGYVTGKVDLGMQFVDIASKETAFYYGVNQTGCYVVSVTKGSNADEAGFHTGDLITKVNGKEVSSSADITKQLEDSKVGDTVKFTVYRSGQTVNIDLTLAEYTPSGKLKSSSNSSENPYNDYSGEDIWSQMFGW